MGIILDSSVIIAAERRGHTVTQILEQIHQSHGDVEVGLASIDELPYVMGLVRQSLEKQMGNGGEA